MEFQNRVLVNQVSLVEQLKELVRAQNESLRHKEAEIKTFQAENARLLGRVAELERENDELKARLDKQHERNYVLSGINRLTGEITPQTSTLNDSSQAANSSQDDLYSTALNTPEPVCKTSTTTLDANHHITITLSSTPNSESKSFPCVQYRDSSKKSFSRTDSQKVKRKSFYELSPDISDKHVQLLENCYGGKKKANHAARVIQQHYRSWIMKKAYLRIRTQSEVRKNSWKGRRIKINLLQSPANNSETLSPITTLPVSHNLSVDCTDSILLNVDRSVNPGSPKTKSPEADTLHPKDEFKAIQTDLNIDENFQDVEVRDTGHGEVSVEHMSEDISSIEISKNLLNDSAGQQMIIDEVFHQIMSPRKDSVTLGGRQNSFRRKNDNESHKEEKEEVQVLECAPEIMSLSHELEEEIQPVEEEAINKEDAVCKEKSVDQDKVTDLNDNLQIRESNVETGKFVGSANVLDVLDAVDGHSYSWPTLDQLVDDSISMGGNSLSPSSSILQTFYEDKEKEMRIGINHFNRKPKKGINFLIDSGVLDDDADSVCKFLREEPGVNKQKIGEYLGDIRNPFSMEVLQAFVRSINLQGKEIDEALRYFQTFFRMPGEAQKIERLVEEFSTAYVEANPGKVSNNPDTILVLSFAIIMLNTDLHSPNVKRKMSKQQFIQNLRGTNDGEDLPSEMLSDVYDRVLKKQFRTGPDNMDTVLKHEKQILGKVPWRTLALPHRQLRQITALYEIQGGKRKEKLHHRIVFLFNDMIVITKERGQAGQKGTHFYSYKSSYSLNDMKFSPFNNNYYKYGIRLLNKSNSQVLISFHAKKEDIRKVFCTELRECIEETTIMESERIHTEKTRQLSAKGFIRRDLDEDTISLTIPRSYSQAGKKAPDSLSLMNEPAILPTNQMNCSKLLSSSLQDLNATHPDGALAYAEESLHKSNSVVSFDSAYSGSDSTRSIPELNLNGSLQLLPKKYGIFSSKRIKNATQRKLAKSIGSLEDIKILEKSVSQNPPQRTSNFFVEPPIAS